MKLLSVLSLNCFDISLFSIFHRKGRLGRLTEEIIRLRPDIVCLQEVNFPDTHGLIAARLKTTGYHVFPEKRPATLLNPAGLVTASRLPVTDAKYVQFSDQGSWHTPDVIERIANRGYHVITARVHKNTMVRIINTHLHCPFGAYEKTQIDPVIHNQWRQIENDNTRDGHAILCGDFNAIPENDLYPKMTAIYVDPLYGSNQVTISPQNTNRKHLHKMNKRIDYTLVTKSLSAGIRQKIIFTEPVTGPDGKRYHLSDHYAVWTDIRI